MGYKEDLMEVLIILNTEPLEADDVIKARRIISNLINQ